jgi:hypothetical protein
MYNISNKIALTGRVKTFLEHPEKGTMPVSCTSYNYDNDLFDCMRFISVALRGGAGINVNLDKFKKRNVSLFNNLFFVQKEVFFVFSEEDKGNYKNSLGVEESLTIPIVIVNDSMQESSISSVSIEQSWYEIIKILNKYNKVIVDLSLLRKEGTINNVGLVASGAKSFASIISALVKHINKGDIVSLMQLLGQINDVLRRGGQYKNGIVTFSLDYTHPDFIKYANTELKELTGSSKKGVIVDKYLLFNKRLSKLIQVRVNDGSLMLEKRILEVNSPSLRFKKLVFGTTFDAIAEEYCFYDLEVKQYRSQVCKEIIFDHAGTCLLLYVNFGQITDFNEIIPAFKEGMQLLVTLWKNWKEQLKKDSSQYATNEQDRQVGLGIVGLANLLNNFNISYKDFIYALKYFLESDNKNNYDGNEKALELVSYIQEAYLEASDIAKKEKIERAFTISPTQTSAYNNVDFNGFTLCKNINPPLSQNIRRTSHTTHNNGWYNHGNVETLPDFIKENGVDAIQVLWELWQKMMNNTGLAHCMSFDLYRKIDDSWLENFLLYSPLVTTYYQLVNKVNQNFLDKGTAQSAVCSIDNSRECAACSE